MKLDLSVSEIEKMYPYFYEMHLHTNVASACGKASPEEMAVACKEYGYTGIVVTEHNWGWNTSVDCYLLISEWDKWIDTYSQAYYRAKKKGDEIGLDVFFGMEAGFNGTEFLIYGLTPDYFIAHPEFRDAKISEMHELVKQGGGVFVHAHPFRDEKYIPEIRLFPEDVDAVEGANGTHVAKTSQHELNPGFDILARDYARKHSLPMTAGSDVHRAVMIGAGIRCKNRIMEGKDLAKLILSGEDYILCDSIDYYWPK